MAKKNPFDDASRLLLPLWNWMDEFEEFFIASEHIYHWTDYIDVPWEHWTDTFYSFDIDWNDIWVQCIFYQKYSREEDEKERKETVYIWIDKVYTKWIKWWDEEAEAKYEDWKLTKDQQKWHDKLVHLNTPHLIEEDKTSRTPEGVAKIKSFLFYQALWKEKAKELIQNEIDKLWDKASEEDLKELNEIMKTWTIKRPKHYEWLYCMKALREMAKTDKSQEWKKQLDDVENVIKQMEEDQD